MEYFFYNTDSRAIIDKPKPRFNVLINQKFAAVGGDRKKFGEQLSDLSPDDILLMYENLVGIVAVGRVLEYWDKITHSDSLYYNEREKKLLTGGAYEYRIAVDWIFDLSLTPFSVQHLMKLIGYNPRGTIQKIVKSRAEIENLIAEIRSTCPHEQQKDNTSLPSKEDFESAYRVLTRLGGSVSVDAVLDQIAINALNMGIELQANWRVMTEEAIKKWSGG